MESRRSVLDVVKEGLQVANRTTFLHRLVYIGEHLLDRVGLEELMKDLITEQADQHNDEALTGFLLCYNFHFVHLLEGSEGSLTRHLRALTNPKLEEAPRINKLKILVEIAHINKRLFNSWTARAVTPPTLGQRLDPKSSQAEVAKQIDNALGKTLRVVENVKRLPPGGHINQATMLLLPEAELLHFLLNVPQLPNIRTILQEHDKPPHLTLYEDIVWPAPPDHVPFDVFHVSKKNELLTEINEEVEKEARGTSNGSI